MASKEFDQVKLLLFAAGTNGEAQLLSDFSMTSATTLPDQQELRKVLVLK